MKRSITAATITGTLVVASALTGTASASATARAQAVPNTKPSWTAHAQNLGHTSNGAKTTGRVYLAPKGGLAAVKSYATAVSTPGNANYRHFLTSRQYYSRFGISKSTVSSVSAYLKSAGLKIDKVGANNRYIAFHGSTRSAEKAFSTTIDKYNHNGKTVQAPSSTAKVPSSLAGAVLSVYGLDTTPHVTKPATKQAAPPAGGFRNARPCSTFFGQLAANKQGDFSTPLPKFQGKTLSYATCGYTGPLYRAAYEGNTSLDGSGVTVAITDAYSSPTIASDSNTYAEAHGDGSYGPGQLTRIGPDKAYNRQSDCGPSGWYGEETLDVEAVHAMAPAANIRYYGSASCFDDDFLDTLQKVVDQAKAQIVTNSWADVEEAETTDSINAYESVFLQGAIEGISFTYSSGDDGDNVAATGLKQVSYPSSDPYVTGVGGTALGIGSSGQKLFETGWGTDNFSLAPNGKSWVAAGYLYGAGGGSSSLFNRPSYQDGVTTAGSRQVPDIGMDADPQTGMLIGITQTFPDGVYYDEYRIGGTSLASPLFAGMTALAIQQAGHSVGLLNPTIYAHRSSFSDVQGTPPTAGVVRVNYVNGVDPSDGVSYFVRTFNQDSSLVVKKGYDQVTGIGAPNTKWLSALK